MNYKTNKATIAYLLAIISIAFVFGFANTANAEWYDDYGYEDYYDYGYDDYGYEDYGGDWYDDYGYEDYYDYDDYGYDDDYCYDCYDDYDDYDYYGYDDYCYDCYEDDYDDYCYDCGYDSTPVVYNYNNNQNQNVNNNTNTNTVIVNAGGSNNNPTPNPTPSLSVSCNAAYSRVDEGDNVTWYANASGGSGSYNYSWSGTDGLSGNSSVVHKSYNNSGTKQASVTVTSGNKSVTENCGSVSVDNDNDNDDDDDDNDDWEVSCKASPSRVEEGETVRWIASTDGISESRVDFEWSRDADGDDEEVTERYNKSGTYEAKVTAEYQGHTETDTCTVRVEDEDNDDNNVVVTQTTPTYTPPTYVPPTLSSVYLSQVPYTGAADTAKLVGFITMLTLASLGGAYYVVTKKARSDRKSFLDRFKQENLAKRA